MPHALLVGRPDAVDPTFVIPFWTRRRADAEAAVARTKRGVGFIFTPFLSLPGPVEDGHLWADVYDVPLLPFLRWKLTGTAPELASIGFRGNPPPECRP